MSANVDGKPVKNLGWLLRNNREVDELVLIGPHKDSGGTLIARMSDGRKFTCRFASYSVMCHWIKRPIFKYTHQVFTPCKYKPSTAGTDSSS